MDWGQLVVNLVLDTSASWLRMFAALALSIVISLFVGIWAATSDKASRIILPLVDIFQTLPILAFFPFVIYVFVFVLPGYIGINAAVVFLIVTSMLWNIIFAVYESIKTMPKEFLDISDLYHMNGFQKLRKIYIQASMPRIVEQSVLSWSIGLFYLVTSEIFSTGTSSYSVTYGIGVALTHLATSGNFTAYLVGILIFIAFVVATRFLFFAPLERRFTYFKGQKVSIVKHRFGMPHKIRIFEELRKVRIRVYITGRKKVKKLKTVAEAQDGELGRKKINPLYYLLAGAALIAIFLSVLYYIGALQYEIQVLQALAASFLRVWLTFVVTLIVAVPVSVYLVFMAKNSENYLLLFQIIASIPATILLPIIVIALQGTPAHSDVIAFVVLFLSGIWYLIFSMLASARTLDPNTFEVKRLFNVKGFSAWKTIYIKALIPGLITGAVTSIAAEWNATIVAEYFTSTGISGSNVLSSVGLGIGKLLDLALANGNFLLLVIALINLTIMIVLINVFVWRRLYARISKVYR